VTRYPGLRRRQLVALRRRIQVIFQDPYSSLNPRHDVDIGITRFRFNFEGLHLQVWDLKQ